MDTQAINRIHREFWAERTRREEQSRIDKVSAVCKSAGLKYDPTQDGGWSVHPLNDNRKI